MAQAAVGDDLTANMNRLRLLELPIDAANGDNGRAAVGPLNGTGMAILARAAIHVCALERHESVGFWPSTQGPNWGGCCRNSGRSRIRFMIPKAAVHSPSHARTNRSTGFGNKSSFASTAVKVGFRLKLDVGDREKLDRGRPRLGRVKPGTLAWSLVEPLRHIPSRRAFRFFHELRGYMKPLPVTTLSCYDVPCPLP